MGRGRRNGLDARRGVAARRHKEVAGEKSGGASNGDNNFHYTVVSIGVRD